MAKVGTSRVRLEKRFPITTLSTIPPASTAPPAKSWFPGLSCGRYYHGVSTASGPLPTARASTARSSTAWNYGVLQVFYPPSISCSRCGRYVNDLYGHIGLVQVNGRLLPTHFEKVDREVNELVDTPALAPAVFSADVLLQRMGELPKGFFDRRQLWWSGRAGAQPGAVNRQLEEPLVHKHPRGVAVRQQVARAVELEIRPRTLARMLRSHRQGSEKFSQRLDEEGHRVYGGPAQRL
jgi:hypothetical protein